MMSENSIIKMREWLVNHRVNARAHMQTGRDTDSWSGVLLRINIEIDLLDRILAGDEKPK
jgi:hypothetical protein